MINSRMCSDKTTASFLPIFHQGLNSYSVSIPDTKEGAGLGPSSGIKSFDLGWRDGSAVKSTDCSSKGPEFKSQQPHGGSQPSVMRSDALFWSV